MDRNNLKVTNQQELDGSPSLSQLQLGGSLTSSAPSLVFKDGAEQLESFQPPTSRPREFAIPRGFCSGFCNPRTPGFTRTKIQAEDFSQVCSQKQTLFLTPLLPQSGTPSQDQINNNTDVPATEGERKVRQIQEVSKPREEEEKGNVNDHQSRRTECPVHPSSPTESDGKSFSEKGLKTLAARSCGATSEDGWKGPVQQSNAQVWTPKHPSMSPTMRCSRVSPRACTDQEVIVSFEPVSGHTQRASALNVETLSTGCDETKTRPLLRQSTESRPGSGAGSNGVKGQKQAATTTALCHSAPSNTRQGPTPPKPRTIPMHSTMRSSGRGGGCSQDGDNPSCQCHHFPKLPSSPSCLGLQDSRFNLRDYGSEWIIRHIRTLKQELGLEHQLQPSTTSSSRDDDAQSNGDFRRYVNSLFSL